MGNPEFAFPLGFMLLNIEFMCSVLRSIICALSFLFSFWPLHFLSFFGLQIFINPLESSNVSFNIT
jgi:hypothetical protein